MVGLGASMPNWRAVADGRRGERGQCGRDPAVSLWACPTRIFCGETCRCRRGSPYEIETQRQNPCLPTRGLCPGLQPPVRLIAWPRNLSSEQHSRPDAIASVAPHPADHIFYPLPTAKLGRSFASSPPPRVPARSIVFVFFFALLALGSRPPRHISRSLHASPRPS